MESMNISTFKAKCLAVLEGVRRTGRPVLVTKRGEPVAEIVPPSGVHEGRWLGSARERGRIVGDIVTPLDEPWEVLER